uniref:Late embryogenesis abundant protein LEA-2 subgroup domain-containing protein n=1 Tax=Kalanchoe fedtschenkoi TaxID=63787 RepID=A0A7N0TAI5_KALFE
MLNSLRRSISKTQLDVLPKMPAKLKHRIDPQTTHPLIWILAIICAIIAIAAIICGVVIFISYLVLHPRIPFVSVVYAHLDAFEYDADGFLQTALTVIIRAENDNLKAHAAFYGMAFVLSLHGTGLAQLQMPQPLDVNRNDTKDLLYRFHSRPTLLDRLQRDFVDLELKRDEVSFVLKGGGRARWRVGALGSAKFWCELDCELKFGRSNGTYVGHRCTSKAR